MAGVEIVGLALGVFPLAIKALDAYREVSRSLFLFHEIRSEYAKFGQDIKYYQLCFKTHLRRLLRRVIEDDDTIEHLLSETESSWWDSPTSTLILQRQVGDDVFEQLVACFQRIKDVMEKLNRKLTLDPILNEQLKKPSQELSPSESSLRGRVRLQLYKLRFSFGEATRDRLFEQLQHHNSKLSELLRIIDYDAQFVQGRTAATNSSPYSTTLCNVWKHANTLFKAISSAWTCHCKDQHLAELLLQHRTTNRNEFSMLFAKQSRSSWYLQKALITAGNDPHSPKPSSRFVNTKNVVHQPDHRASIPIRSILRKEDINKQKKPSQPRSQIACASFPVERQLSHEVAIYDLCQSLDHRADGCYGYLVESDSKYFVCRLSHQQVEGFKRVTIDQILRREVSLPLRRRHRYALSLTLASSFLQLLDTYWLPESWKRSDIAFINAEKDTDVFLLDQPYLKREFIESPPPNSSQKQALTSGNIVSSDNKIPKSVKLVGTLLLELYLGQLLEEHPVRKEWPAGDNELEKREYDINATQQIVRRLSDKMDPKNDEEDPNFVGVVAWCIQENYEDKTPENWRRKMLEHVVMPLEACHNYFG